MNKIIFYFHGLNSNAFTEKYQKLKQQFSRVHSFPIDLDYEKAYSNLCKDINQVLLENLLGTNEGSLEDINEIFIGTSLGGYWAGHLSNVFQCPAILINPVFDPRTALNTLGVDTELCTKYPQLIPNKKHHVFISKQDEVLSFPKRYLEQYQQIYYYSNSDHRFSGPEFNDVIELIKKL